MALVLGSVVVWGERAAPSPQAPGPIQTFTGGGKVSPALTGGAGIWADVEKLRTRSTTGEAWRAIVADADDLGRGDEGADVADQDSNHDQLVLAASLVCVRLRAADACQEAERGLLEAIGTEEGGRWLAIGRNLGSYVIAADVLGLRADREPRSSGTRIDHWIRSFLTVELKSNNSGDDAMFVPFSSGSNASAQEGFVYAAVAAYLRDRVALDRAWDAFRRYACDPSAPDPQKIDLRRGVEYGWAHDSGDPCAVNPKGSEKDGVRIDGALINDMRRGGAFAHPPEPTSYPWVGVEGFVPAALVLQRAGYPAFEVADRAVLRSMDYLWWLRQVTGERDWFDGKRAAETIQIVNAVYGTEFPLKKPAGGGRTVGYTDWTHPVAG